MTAEAVELHGFAYGELLEGPERRSLGYRLLVPAEQTPWSAEVDGLARRLQAAPYPDHWPATDLFCSVLLADGRRLIAAARYGLADHTASRRRGGLELVGVVAPAGLNVPTALGVYRWLRGRRGAVQDLRDHGGRFPLAEALKAGPAPPPECDPVPVLPVRLWQQGALLFAATDPSEPDRRLGLLGQEAGAGWQWLPLVGADFPLAQYAARGPLFAWTPHLAGLAVKLDHRADDRAAAPSGALRFFAAALAGLLVLLLGANLWALRNLRQDMRTSAPPAAPQPAVPSVPVPVDDSAERFARALHRLLQPPGGAPAVTPDRVAERFERLAGRDRNLRLAGPEGRELVVAAELLAKRNADPVEAAVRQALQGRGYDPQLIDLVCQRVRDQLQGEHP